MLEGRIICNVIIVIIPFYLWLRIIRIVHFLFWHESTGTAHNRGFVRLCSVYLQPTLKITFSLLHLVRAAIKGAESIRRPCSHRQTHPSPSSSGPHSAQPTRCKKPISLEAQPFWEAQMQERGKEEGSVSFANQFITECAFEFHSCFSTLFVLCVRLYT